MFRSEFCVQSLNPAREFPRIIRVTLIVFVKLGPVAGVWVAECLALPDAERLELNISNRERPHAHASFRRLGERHLQISRVSYGGVPREVRVSKDVARGCERLDTLLEVVGSDRLGEVWEEEHALFREEFDMREEVAEGDDRLSGLTRGATRMQEFVP